MTVFARSALLLENLTTSGRQTAFEVHRDFGVGVDEADRVVEGKVLVEPKAASGLRPEHEAQTLNYLKAAGLRVGLLVNFGRQILQVRRLVP